MAKRIKSRAGHLRQKRKEQIAEAAAAALNASPVAQRPWGPHSSLSDAPGTPGAIRAAAAQARLTPGTLQNKTPAAGPGLLQQLKGWHAGVKAKPGVGGFMARNPMLTGGVALAAAPMVARMLAKGVKGLGDSITGAGAMDEEDDARAERAGMLAQQMRVKRLQQDMRINAIRMMQSDPALAQELMAGRRLPKGATVIGGRQRQDLLMEAAARMGQMPEDNGGGY